MRWKGLSLLTISLMLFTACSDEPEARVYTVPKEEAESAPAASPPPMMASGNGGSMANQTLPESSLNQGAIPPAWDIPATWERSEGSPMRLASFVVEEESGNTLDIAVTSFPGDVGGLVANVNRWRSQLNLPDASPSEVEDAVETLPTRSGDATVVELSNGTTATLAAILMHDGASWFIKMTGPSALVEREKEHFRAFVRSTDFAATHNH